MVKLLLRSCVYAIRDCSLPPGLVKRERESERQREIEKKRKREGEVEGEGENEPRQVQNMSIVLLQNVADFLS